MNGFFIKLLGYILISTGIYIGYLSLINNKMFSKTFNKKIYRIIIIILSLVVIIVGWFLVV